MPKAVRDALCIEEGDEVLFHVEVDRLDFAGAYLVASAESTGVNKIASFDNSIDRVPTVERIDPSGAPS